MNITKYTALLPLSFDWTTTVDGADVTETLSVEINRLSFGLGTSKELRKGLDEQDGDAIAGLLASLIASWNLDADGEPFPPTADNIKLLPMDFAAVLAEKVLATLSPNPQTANDSDNGSAPAESSSAASKTA